MFQHHLDHIYYYHYYNLLFLNHQYLSNQPILTMQLPFYLTFFNIPFDFWRTYFFLILLDTKRNLFGSVITFTLFGALIAIPSSDGISISSSTVIVSIGDLKSSSIVVVSTKGSFTSIIPFEIFLISCLSSLSNSPYSIQISSVWVFLNGLSSSKILSIKLMVSSCIFVQSLSY